MPSPDVDDDVDGDDGDDDDGRIRSPHTYTEGIISRRFLFPLISKNF